MCDEWTSLICGLKGSASCARCASVANSLSCFSFHTSTRARKSLPWSSPFLPASVCPPVSSLPDSGLGAFWIDTSSWERAADLRLRRKSAEDARLWRESRSVEAETPGDKNLRFHSMILVNSSCLCVRVCPRAMSRSQCHDGQLKHSDRQQKVQTVEETLDLTPPHLPWSPWT